MVMSSNVVGLVDTYQILCVLEITTMWYPCIYYEWFEHQVCVYWVAQLLIEVC